MNRNGTIDDFNRRFAKPPRNDWNAHRPVRSDEDLNLIFTFREKRKVTHALTLQYDKTIYMIEDNRENRNLIGKYIDVYEYPDGRIELHATPSEAIAYVAYDRLSEVDQGAIVENKRLGHVLQIAQLIQEQRDSRRGRSSPARTNQGLASVRLKAAPGKKVQRKLDESDLLEAMSNAAAIKQCETLEARPAALAEPVRTEIDLSLLDFDVESEERPRAEALDPQQMRERKELAEKAWEAMMASMRGRR